MSRSICTCGDHIYVTDEGVLCIVPGSFGPRLTLVYKSSGTFTKADYPWLARLRSKVQAGGGSGGGCIETGVAETSFGGGGGGGGYAEDSLGVGSLADLEIVTVGDGGGATVGGSGEPGGDSMFGPHCKATGGEPGIALGFAAAVGFSPASGGNGGQGTTGDVKFGGGRGGFGWGRGDENLRKGGRGGASHFGGGQGGRATSGDGTDGRSNTGEGGGGACNGSEIDETRSGGKGGSGIVILELYG